MSRCFPFPPPGYERKARNDGEDLLEKEKNREKKHKKEKKDKEKREGKEKREKDRSDGKHREKKDKKEKHKDRDRDRDKDKDKDKDKKKDKEKDGERSKDKSKHLDEKRLSGQTESHVGEKLIQKEGKQKGNSIDKKFSGQIGGHKAEKLSQNSSLDDKSKYVEEFGGRIKDQATGTGNRLENFSGADWKKDEGMLRLVAKDTSNLAAGKEDRRIEDRTADGQGTRDGTKAAGNAMFQNITAIAQTKLEALPRPLEKNAERKIEGNEKTKDRESGDIRGIKSREKDKEKKSHGKDKDRDKDKEKKKEDREKRKEDKQKKKEEKQKKKEEKEKKKEERAKEKIQLKATELDKLRVSNKNDIVENHTIKPPQLPKDSNNNAPNDVNLKKRKDIETNGVLHAHEILPVKVAKTMPSSHPSTQNGRILEPCQASVPASDRKEASNNLKMDNKERKINGIIEAQPSSVSPMKHKSATAVADPNAKPSARPPHPDSKYLNQIYSVPKMEEWSDFDDQDWLFSSDSSQTKKLKVEALAVEETPLVWAEARQIGSADICALPYVVPY